MVNGIEGEHYVDGVRVEGELASVRSGSLEAVNIGTAQETRCLGDHPAAPIEASQMELRHHLQEKEGVPARTAANVYGDATLMPRKQVSDMRDRFVIGHTHVVVLVC
jgi:hypothetical protein